MAKRKPARRPVVSTGRKLPEWCQAAAALAALAFVVYANSLGNGFVSDDKIQLLKNPLVTSLANVPRILGSGVWSILGIAGSPGNYYRPLQFLVYLGLYECAGFNAAVFHLFLVLVHAGNTVLVFLLVRRLAMSRAALAAAALFAVHPIHTEVVNWVAAVPDLLVTTWALLGVHWLAGREQPPRGWQIAGHCGIYLLALLTKETGVMLLPLYFGLGFFFPRRGWQELRRNGMLYAAMAVTFAVYLAMRWNALGSLAPGQEAFFHLGPAEFVLSALVLAGQYLAALLFPVDLNYFHIFHPATGFTAACWMAAAGLAAAAAAVYRWRTPLAAYGVFWIVVSLAPAFNLTGVGQNVLAERYLYLPSVGFCWIAGWGWDLLANRRRTVAVAAGTALLLAGAGEAVARNGDWRDDYTLFSVTLRQSPTSGWLHNWMAGVYAERRDFDRALQESKLAVKYEPLAPAFRQNLGNALLIKDPQAAIVEFQKLVAMQPGLAENHSDLGIALEAAGQPREAAAEFLAALRLQPDYREAQEGYRRVMAQMRQP